MTDDPLFTSGPAGRLHAQLLMPPLMRNHGNYIVSLGQSLPLARRAGDGAGGGSLSLVSPPPRFFTTRTEPSAGVATGDMGIGRDGKPNGKLLAGVWSSRASTRSSPKARAARLTKVLTAVRPRKGCGPEVRARPQGAVGGGARQAAAGPRAAHAWLASDNRRGAAPSFIITAPTWCRSASSCTSITPIPTSRPTRIPALQVAPDDPRHIRGRPAHRLWRARFDRGRLAVDPQAYVPWRRAGRMRRWAL